MHAFSGKGYLSYPRKRVSKRVLGVNTRPWANVLPVQTGTTKRKLGYGWPAIFWLVSPSCRGCSSNSFKPSFSSVEPILGSPRASGVVQGVRFLTSALTLAQSDGHTSSSFGRAKATKALCSRFNSCLDKNCPASRARVQF